MKLIVNCKLLIKNRSGIKAIINDLQQNCKVVATKIQQLYICFTKWSLFEFQNSLVNLSRKRKLDMYHPFKSG